MQCPSKGRKNPHKRMSAFGAILSEFPHPPLQPSSISMSQGDTFGDHRECQFICQSSFSSDLASDPAFTVDTFLFIVTLSFLPFCQFLVQYTNCPTLPWLQSLNILTNSREFYRALSGKRKKPSVYNLLLSPSQFTGAVISSKNSNKLATTPLPEMMLAVFNQACFSNCSLFDTLKVVTESFSLNEARLTGLSSYSRHPHKYW